MKQQAAHYDFLTTGGKMGKMIAQTDWANHPFGPIQTWPQSLKSALSICMSSKFPMSIYWGTDLRLLYNDAWSPILRDKHPAALGHPAREVWRDIWELIEPDLKRVMKTGEGTTHKNELLPLNRRGFIEESYFDYTFSPIFGENQQILGVFNVVQEITMRVLHERRMRTMRNLADKSFAVESPEAACILIANVLSEAPADIPFGLIYLLNSEATSLKLVGSTSLENDTSIAHSTVDISVKDTVLPFKKVLATKNQQLVKNLDKYYELPGGIWDEPASCALLTPLIRPHTQEMYGVLVSGISPRLNYNDNYANYFKQIAELTASSIGNAYDLGRKLALEAREHEAQERLQTALSTGSIGIWVWDILNNKIILDQNLADLFGVGHEEARTGLPLSVLIDSIHPDDRQRVVKEIQLAAEKTKLYEAEYRTIGRDGTIKWVISRGKVEDSADGNPIRFPGVIVDITDRKKIEQELASSERKFNALFESHIIGVAVMTLDGKIHEANERFLTMFGYKKSILEQGFYSHMITPTKSKGVTSLFYQLLRKKGEVNPMEKEYLRKDGTIIPVLVGGVMIRGSTDRFIAFMLDISRQKELMAINKAKDDFISIASHQLRTPATGVKQYLGMMIEGYVGKFEQNQMKMLKTAYASNERQLAIVNDLLRVAQADANGIQLKLAKTNVALLLQDVINEQAEKFQAGNQTIAFQQHCKDCSIMLDPLLIRMVFENLIDNAHKYTPAGKTISVGLAKKRGSLIITVKDEGIGIRKKDTPKLFKKFSRIENPLSTSAGGTGLGLYWVYKIVELHQGTISVSSQYRHGTQFTVTLPGEK